MLLLDRVLDLPGLVATDLVGLDEPADRSDPVHNCLLRADIPQLQVLTTLRRLADGALH